jgi:hypothetical protein
VELDHDIAVVLVIDASLPYFRISSRPPSTTPAAPCQLLIRKDGHAVVYVLPACFAFKALQRVSEACGRRFMRSCVDRVSRHTSFPRSDDSLAFVDNETDSQMDLCPLWQGDCLSLDVHRLAFALIESSKLLPRYLIKIIKLLCLSLIAPCPARACRFVQSLFSSFPNPVPASAIILPS